MNHAFTVNRYSSTQAVIEALTPSYPVFCIFPDQLRTKAQEFCRLFPGKVLYAVKCNPHPLVMRALWAGGVRAFDTASLPEIALTKELFDEAECFFHHPVKNRAAIRAAHDVYGVEFFTVDHPNELTKIAEETRGAPVVAMVRLRTASGYATFDLSAKFGAEPDLAVELLRRAHAMGMRTGLAFHVGSQCRYPEAYAAAIQIAAEVRRAAGVPVGWLDVGGGFPAQYVETPAPPLAAFMAAIKTAVADHGFHDLELLAEPGRALVADGCKLIVQVQLRKENQLYINDGIYGSISEVIYDKDFHPPMRVIRPQGPAPKNETKPFVFFGPTCDSNDRLPRSFELPEDVREGDWIEISQMGAYSVAVSSNFNGFSAETFVEISG